MFRCEHFSDIFFGNIHSTVLFFFILFFCPENWFHARQKHLQQNRSYRWRQISWVKFHHSNSFGNVGQLIEVHMLLSISTVIKCFLPLPWVNIWASVSNLGNRYLRLWGWTITTFGILCDTNGYPFSVCLFDQFSVFQLLQTYFSQFYRFHVFFCLSFFFFFGSVNIR